MPTAAALSQSCAGKSGTSIAQATTPRIRPTPPQMKRIHVSLGAQLFPMTVAIIVASCLLGAVVSAKFANCCEIRRLNRIVGVVLILLGAVTILIKLL